jgi:pimeloyl-ACP methyl ester carboxylesterase
MGGTAVKRFMTVGCAVLLAAALTVTALKAAEPVALKTTELGRGPTVVFVHGLGSGRMVWMPTARKLLADHRVVMVDLPGHGESAAPDPFSLDACAAALDQVFAKHKPDSTVVVAHGMGALVAMQAVQSHPDRVRGLVVIDAATRSPTKVPDQQQKYFFRSLDTRYHDVVRMMFTAQSRDSNEAREVMALVQKVPPATMKSYIQAAMNADVSAGLKAMKPSFLYVGSERLWPADKDWPTLAKEMGYEQAAAIETRRVAGSGVLIMKDQPDSLAAILKEFTARAIAKK